MHTLQLAWNDRPTKSVKASRAIVRRAFNPSKRVRTLSVPCGKREEDVTNRDEGVTIRLFVGNKRRQYPSLCLARAHPGEMRAAALFAGDSILHPSRDRVSTLNGEHRRSSSTSNGTLVFWKRATSPPRHSSNPAISVPHNLLDCIPRRRIIFLRRCLSLSLPPSLSLSLSVFLWFCTWHSKGQRKAENSIFCAACNSKNETFLSLLDFHRGWWKGPSASRDNDRASWVSGNKQQISFDGAKRVQFSILWFNLHLLLVRVD